MKLYVIVERNYEYNDEVYTDEGYNLPKEAYQLEANAEQVANAKNLEWLGGEGDLSYVSAGSIGYDGTDILSRAGASDLTQILCEVFKDDEEIEDLDVRDYDQWEYGRIRKLIKQLPPEYHERLIDCFGNNLPYIVQAIEVKC